MPASPSIARMRMPVRLLLALLIAAGLAASEADLAEFTRRQEAAGDQPAALWTLVQWCRARGLNEQAAATCEKIIALAPDHADARRQLGYEQVGGAWLKGEPLYQAKGYVHYLGRWMSKSDRVREEARRERLRAQSLAHREWSKAWTGSTKYFAVRSNAPGRVVEEIGRSLDQCIDTLGRIFEPRSMPRAIPLEIYATQEEFIQASGASGIPVGRGTLGYFYYGGNGSGIRCFHAGSLDRTLGVLFHECTHLMVRAAFGEDVPTWANEGMAVFMEFAKRTDTGIDIISVPWDRLWALQDQIASPRPPDLAALVALKGEYAVQYYPQGWGLVSYLLYAKQGRLRERLKAFYQKPQRGDPIAGFKAAFGASPAELQADWIATFAKREPATLPELIDAAQAAIWYRYDAQRAVGYAEQAVAKAPADRKALAARARVMFAVARLAGTAQAWTDAAAAYEAVAPEPVRKGTRRAPSELAMDGERAIALARSGDPRRAIALAGQMIDADEASSAPYRTLAEIAIVADDPEIRDLDQAAELLAVADDLGRSHENDHVHALLLAARERRSEALERLARAAELDAFGFGAALYRIESRRIQDPGGAQRQRVGRERRGGK